MFTKVMTKKKSNGVEFWFIKRTIDAINTAEDELYSITDDGRTDFENAKYNLLQDTKNRAVNMYKIEGLRVEMEEREAAQVEKIDALKAKLSKQLAITFSLLIVVIFIISYIAAKLTNPSFGHIIHTEYYQVLAGILPAILIAVFLSPSRKITTEQKNTTASPWNLLMSNGKLEGLIGFSIGELACLTAIATGSTGTAIFLGTIFSLVIMIPATYKRIVYGNLN